MASGTRSTLRPWTTRPSVRVCARTAPGEPPPRYARLRGDSRPPRRRRSLQLADLPSVGRLRRGGLPRLCERPRRTGRATRCGGRVLHAAWLHGAGWRRDETRNPQLRIDDPEHLGQLLNAIFVVAAGVLVYLMARVLWPGRPVLWFAAVGFFAFFPTVVKTGAMFHLEPVVDASHGRRASRARALGP